VVRHLQEVERRQAALDQRRVDVLLHVARQQESVALDLPEQDDGFVVDRAAVVGEVAR